MSKKRYKRTPAGYKRYIAAATRRLKENRKDPAYRAIEAEKARLRYHANKEKYRLRVIEYQDKNRKIINEKRRLRRRRDTALAKSKERKWYANSIKATIAKVRRGDVTIEQLSERLRESLTRADGKLEREKRRRRESSV